MSIGYAIAFVGIKSSCLVANEESNCSRLSRLVVIKIGKSELCHNAEGGEEEGESKILQRLTEGPANHAGKEHIVQLLDRFNLSGLNGRHLCLVAEALGHEIEPTGHAPKAAWEVAKQLVKATAYMHEKGVTYGDRYVVSSSEESYCANTYVAAYTLRFLTFPIYSSTKGSTHALFHSAA